MQGFRTLQKLYQRYQRYFLQGLSGIIVASDTRAQRQETLFPPFSLPDYVLCVIFAHRLGCCGVVCCLPQPESLNQQPMVARIQLSCLREVASELRYHLGVTGVAQASQSSRASAV